MVCWPIDSSDGSDKQPCLQMSQGMVQTWPLQAMAGYQASRVLLSLKMEGGGQLTSYMYKDQSKRLQQPVYAF